MSAEARVHVIEQLEAAALTQIEYRVLAICLLPSTPIELRLLFAPAP